MNACLSKLVVVPAICLAVFVSCGKPEITSAELRKLPLSELRKLGQKGELQAETLLGHKYFYGDGVAVDKTEAFKWYRKAAEQGYAEAQCSVGYCYGTGTGVALDHVESVKWEHRSANQGYAPAQARVGLSRLFGHETSGDAGEDLIEAYKWLRLATVGGYRRDISTYPPGRQYLAQCRRQMTPKQITEATRRAREFTPIKEDNPLSAHAPAP